MLARTLQRLIVLLSVALLARTHAAAPISFADDIQPLLERSCLPCHNATKSEGGLQLETPKLMLIGGENGPAIVPNKALDSILFLSASQQKKPFMPPPANKSKAPPLSSMQVELLRRWIDEGAQGNPKPKQPVAWQTMPANVQRIGAVAVTPDGQFAACGRGGEVSIYNIPMQRPVARFPAHPDVISALAFSPDGNVLATGSYGEFKLWKRTPGPALEMPKLPPLEKLDLTDLPALGTATAAVLVHSGSDILHVSGGTDAKIKVWSRTTKALLRTIPVDGPVKLLSASGNTLAVATEGHPVRLLNLSDGKTIADLSADRATFDHTAVLDLEAAGAAFELGFLQTELKTTQTRYYTLIEDAKKADKELADFKAKRADLEKAKTETTAKRDALIKPRDDAEEAAMAAPPAQEAAKKLEADAQKAAALAKAAADKAASADKPALTKAAEEANLAVKKAGDAHAAADKAANAANEKQKKVRADFEEATKAAAAASSEVQRADHAETVSIHLAAEIAAGKEDEKSLQAAVAIAQKANDAALKTQATAREQLAKQPLSPVKALAFTTEPPLLLTAHVDGTVRDWNPELVGAALDSGSVAPKWELLRTVGDARDVHSPLTARVNALSFSPDGNLLATGSGDPSRSGEIKLWDPATGVLVREIPKPHKDSVLALDFSSDGKLLASGSADKAVRLWDVATGKLAKNLEAHASHVLAVSLRHDSRRLASAGADNCIKTWNLKTSDVIKTFNDFTKEVNGLQYLGHSDRLLATGGGPIVRVVNDAGGDVRSKTDGFAKFVTAAAASRDGQVQVIGDATGILRVLNFDGKILAQWPSSTVLNSAK